MSARDLGIHSTVELQSLNCQELSEQCDRRHIVSLVRNKTVAWSPGDNTLRLEQWDVTNGPPLCNSLRGKNYIFYFPSRMKWGNTANPNRKQRETQIQKQLFIIPWLKRVKHIHLWKKIQVLANNFWRIYLQTLISIIYCYHTLTS